MKLKKVNNLLKSIIYSNPNIVYTCNPFKIYEFKELLKGINIMRNDIILDLGCGVGLQTTLLGKRCKKIYGIDISKARILNAKFRSQYITKRINYEFRAVKMENVGFETESFDKIFSICVLEHIPNYIEVLKEIFRTLKKGGQLIFSVDALENIENPNLINYHKKRFSVVRYFKRNDLKNLLKSLGFKKINIYPIFKSDYAKKLFFRELDNKVRFRYVISFFKYFILKFSEIRSKDKKEGLFLIVKCDK